MIGEWFPAKQTGYAQGIYSGWGNFGSAASAMVLPTLALMFGGDDGWRYALTITAIIAFFYGIYYYLSVTDTPKGPTYFKPKKTGGMEVTSKADLVLYLIMSMPIYGALALLVWKLSPSGQSWLSEQASIGCYLIILAVYFYQAFQIIKINKDIFTKEVPDMFRYSFKQVAILDLAYMVTFGSELALVSMLPLLYVDMFGLSPITAGLLAAIYPVMNLIARPAGGVFSDKVGA